MRMNTWGCFLGLCLISAPVLAGDTPVSRVMSDAEWKELATKRNCVMCHEMGPDALGPNLKDIAKEYAGNEDAEMILARKVYEGGVGKWGDTMMPSQVPPASPDEIRALVRYMLTIRE